jgi:CO/xanthine dehydrogenase FAD-binding subunit
MGDKCVKRFDYLAPTSLREAVDILAENPETLPLAGGTDLVVQIKERHRPVSAVMSLKRVQEAHEYTNNGILTIGSAVKVGRIAGDPWIRQKFSALAVGASLIGSVQIQNMASVGGNICNASPSADTAPPLLALDAQLLIASTQGERTLPLSAFFLAPGKTALQPGELLKAILLSHPKTRSGSFYYRHTPRARMDIAVVGSAAMLSLDEDGKITEARIALGAVAPTPIRAVEAEMVLLGQMPSEDLFTQAASAAMAVAIPIDDLRASADYRRHLVNIYTQRALRQALMRAKENHGI